MTFLPLPQGSRRDTILLNDDVTPCTKYIRLRINDFIGLELYETSYFDH